LVKHALEINFKKTLNYSVFGLKVRTTCGRWTQKSSHGPPTQSVDVPETILYYANKL